ncbi:hypothetical protein DSM21852_14810 [Methylocystis bryophila]|nr:hypothetical protein DSM21852_14810 [Methylocystis bryophila]
MAATEARRAATAMLSGAMIHADRRMKRSCDEPDRSETKAEPGPVRPLMKGVREVMAKGSEKAQKRRTRVTR